MPLQKPLQLPQVSCFEGAIGPGLANMGSGIECMNWITTNSSELDVCSIFLHSLHCNMDKVFQEVWPIHLNVKMSTSSEIYIYIYILGR